MKKDLHIKIDEITRVEGHGSVVIDIKKGVIKDMRLDIIESPRFFEVMLRGRRYDEAQHIMSRICGICAVSHSSASLKAVEDAMKIKISKQSELLRKLAFCGETIQSHILHLFFLVFPDFLGEGSIIPVISTHPDIAKIGLKLKRLANEICAVVAGRHIHPISLLPGGVAHTPKAAELKRLRASLVESFIDLEFAAELLEKVHVRDYSRQREFLTLKARGSFAAYDGEPYSSKKYAITTKAFTKKIKERVVGHSSAKHAFGPKGAYMVGALARVNNNWSALSKRAKAVATEMNLKPPVYNPYLNNNAQLVESIHFTEEAIDIIDRLLSTGLKNEALKKPTSHGIGVGIVEAPRGLLYHSYEIDAKGIIKSADCIIPTAQNLATIEEDMRDLVPKILDKPKDEIRRAVESLVRAYDPCISCSTHFMDVEFI